MSSIEKTHFENFEKFEVYKEMFAEVQTPADFDKIFDKIVSEFLNQKPDIVGEPGYLPMSFFFFERWAIVQNILGYDTSDKSEHLRILLRHFHERYCSLIDTEFFFRKKENYDTWRSIDQKNGCVNITKIREILPNQKERYELYKFFPVEQTEVREFLRCRQFLTFIYLSSIELDIELDIIMLIFSKMIKPKISTLIRFAPKLPHITREQLKIYPTLWEFIGYDEDWNEDWKWNGPDEGCSWSDWTFRNNDVFQNFQKEKKKAKLKKQDKKKKNKKKK